MRLTLALETGNVTSDGKEIRLFQLEAARPLDKAILALSGVVGEVRSGDWPLLVEQVKASELVKRHVPKSLRPPLGGERMLPVIRQINSTPTYQLFLAGIDVAERIELVSESSPESVTRRFVSLDKWMPSITGAGGLFFLPAAAFSEHSQATIQELVRNNKLCSASLSSGPVEIRRYYVPYATPIGFVVRPVSKEAERLWDDVRSLYYTFRPSA